MLQEQAIYTPDSLVSGDHHILTQPKTIALAGLLVRGTVLGAVLLGAAVAVAAGGNTGNGVPGAVAPGTKAQVGDYVATCIAAAINGGTFKVIAPDGTRLDDLTVAVAYAGPHVNLTIADGAADFIVGDVFTITVAAGSGEYVLSLAAAVDGSQTPKGILAVDTDTTAAALPAPVYVSGQFNPDPLVMTYGAGHTEATVDAAFEGTPLFLRKPTAV